MDSDRPRLTLEGQEVGARDRKSAHDKIKGALKTTKKVAKTISKGVGAAVAIVTAFTVVKGAVDHWWPGVTDRWFKPTAEAASSMPAAAGPAITNVSVAPPPHVTRKVCSSPWSSECGTSGCGGAIKANERFVLHLSGIYLNANVDPCIERPTRDVWLCEGAVCLSQREACANAHGETGAVSSEGFGVSGAELENGFTMQVRESGADGPLLAELRPAYGTALMKPGFMCVGGTYKHDALGADAGPIAKLSYYLEPQPE